MIYFIGPLHEAELVASDVADNCPDLLVNMFPNEPFTIQDWLHSHVWTVVVAMPKECPMLNVFAFTDEQRRTFQWGLDQGPNGESIIVCTVSQDYSVQVKGPEGEPRIRGRQVQATGRGTIAQMAYDSALGDLAVALDKAKHEMVNDPPTLDAPLEGPHRLFGKD
jgi:hypothetical protein